MEFWGSGRLVLDAKSEKVESSGLDVAGPAQLLQEPRTKRAHNRCTSACHGPAGPDLARSAGVPTYAPPARTSREVSNGHFLAFGGWWVVSGLRPDPDLRSGSDPSGPGHKNFQGHKFFLDNLRTSKNGHENGHEIYFLY